MTPRERQMAFRSRAKTVMNIVAVEMVMVLATVTWLLGIW